MSVKTIFLLLAAGIMGAMWGCARDDVDVEEDMPVTTAPEAPRPEVADAPAPEPEAEPEPVEPSARDLPEPAETWTGTVVGVTDADRLEVRHNGEVVELRLYGVDAPERRQAFGPLARRFTTRAVMGRQVTVHLLDLEKYDHQGREVAEVITPAGESLAEGLVREGLAWWYERYVAEDELLADLQEEARADKRGLWADAHAVAPWDLREGIPGTPLQDEELEPSDEDNGPPSPADAPA